MLSFQMFGIPVRIEPFFWLTMGFIGLMVHGGDPANLSLILVFIIAGFLSILIHEFGHAFMIRKYGLPTAITLIAFGGYASYPSGVLSRKQSFLVTAAGPGVQVLFGLLVLFLLPYSPIPRESLLYACGQYFVLVSIFWAILNCLPIYPMDGGQMLAAILGPKREQFVYLTGFVVAILIGAIGFIYLQAILLPVFMGFFAWKNWQDYQSHSAGR